MPRVAARFATSAVMVAIALVLFSTTLVYAKGDPDNPNGSHDGLLNNPGHHYGQLKHQPPAPVQNPLPTPAPTHAPVPAQSPAATAQPAARPSPLSESQPTSKVPDVPVVTLPTQPSGQISVAAARPAGDALWWLLLLVLPLLLAIWVLAFTRLAFNALLRRRGRKLNPRMAPVPT